MTQVIKNRLSGINTTPNYISFFRLLLSIPIYLTMDMIPYDNNYRYFTLVLILIAAISDNLDGYIARKRNQISEFGKIIDPLADKVLILIISIRLYTLQEIIPLYFWIVVSRDVFIFLGGIIISKKIGKVLPSNFLGKITVLSIGIFLAYTISGLSKSHIVYSILFYISILLCILSLVGYIIRAYDALKWKKNVIA